MFLLGLLLSVLFIGCKETTSSEKRYFNTLDCGCFNNEQLMYVSTTKSLFNSGDTITIFRFIDHMRNDNRNWMLDKENRRLDTIYSVSNNHLLEIEYKTCIIQ